MLADVGNGTLTLQNLHANKHGEGLKLSKGTLKAFNLSFNQRDRHLGTSDEADANMTGFITNGRFQTLKGRQRPSHVIER